MYWELYRWWSRRKEVLGRARDYVREIKRICVEAIDGECRVMLFGSAARGDYRVDSDVDVLVITDRAKTPWDKALISAKIKEEMGLDDPFELHVVTKKEYEEWYRKFIDTYEEF
ncbi:MAG: nucleotidyltransferase domain-containing protein [Thermoproteus sp.]|jgi:hypothetical protein|nr:nucleotidyltransferase domain-containing protein [Thermoproteus sp.]MDT7882658.1 nucleotidyltransferase domain-containing protein [Thermoproteus sp.]